jgi:hypothetical protein
MGEHSPMHGFYPVVPGIKMVRAVNAEYQLVLSTPQIDPSAVEFWLRINGMTQPSFYDELLYREDSQADLTNPALLARHAGQLRANGYDVGLVVSSDPEAILQVTEMGFPSLLFVNPAYRWGEYRPDHKRLPRPWQDIDDEVIRQRELKAKDPRLSEQEEEEKV